MGRWRPYQDEDALGLNVSRTAGGVPSAPYIAPVTPAGPSSTEQVFRIATAFAINEQRKRNELAARMSTVPMRHPMAAAPRMPDPSTALAGRRPGLPSFEDAMRAATQNLTASRLPDPSAALAGRTRSPGPSIPPGFVNRLPSTGAGAPQEDRTGVAGIDPFAEPPAGTPSRFDLESGALRRDVIAPAAKIAGIPLTEWSERVAEPLHDEVATGTGDAMYEWAKTGTASPLVIGVYYKPFDPAQAQPQDVETRRQEIVRAYEQGYDAKDKDGNTLAHFDPGGRAVYEGVYVAGDPFARVATGIIDYPDQVLLPMLGKGGKAVSTVGKVMGGAEDASTAARVAGRTVDMMGRVIAAPNTVLNEAPDALIKPVLGAAGQGARKIPGVRKLLEKAPEQIESDRVNAFKEGVEANIAAQPPTGYVGTSPMGGMPEPRPPDRLALPQAILNENPYQPDIGGPRAHFSNAKVDPRATYGAAGPNQAAIVTPASGQYGTRNYSGITSPLTPPDFSAMPEDRLAALPQPAIEMGPGAPRTPPPDVPPPSPVVAPPVVQEARPPDVLPGPTARPNGKPIPEWGKYGPRAVDYTVVDATRGASKPAPRMIDTVFDDLRPKHPEAWESFRAQYEPRVRASLDRERALDANPKFRSRAKPREAWKTVGAMDNLANGLVPAYRDTFERLGNPLPDRPVSQRPNFEDVPTLIELAVFGSEERRTAQRALATLEKKAASGATWLAEKVGGVSIIERAKQLRADVLRNAPEMVTSVPTPSVVQTPSGPANTLPGMGEAARPEFQSARPAGIEVPPQSTAPPLNLEPQVLGPAGQRQNDMLNGQGDLFARTATPAPASQPLPDPATLVTPQPAPDAVPPTATTPQRASGVIDINPTEVIEDPRNFQPRSQRYNRAGITEASINDIVQNYNPNRFDPIKVWHRPDDDAYVVISGHHRLEASRRLNLENIPATVVEGDLAEAKRVARQSNSITALKPTEYGRAVRAEMDEGVNINQAAATHKLKRADAERYVRSTYMPDDLQELLDNGQLKISQASLLGEAVQDGTMSTADVQSFYRNRMLTREYTDGQLKNVLDGLRHHKAQANMPGQTDLFAGVDLAAPTTSAHFDRLEELGKLLADQKREVSALSRVARGAEDDPEFRILAEGRRAKVSNRVKELEGQLGRGDAPPETPIQFFTAQDENLKNQSVGSQAARAMGGERQAVLPTPPQRLGPPQVTREGASVYRPPMDQLDRSPNPILSDTTTETFEAKRRLANGRLIDAPEFLLGPRSGFDGMSQKDAWDALTTHAQRSQDEWNRLSRMGVKLPDENAGIVVLNEDQKRLQSLRDEWRRYHGEDADVGAMDPRRAAAERMAADVIPRDVGNDPAKALRRRLRDAPITLLFDVPRELVTADPLFSVGYTTRNVVGNVIPEIVKSVRELRKPILPAWQELRGIWRGDLSETAFVQDFRDLLDRGVPPELMKAQRLGESEGVKRSDGAVRRLFEQLRMPKVGAVVGTPFEIKRSFDNYIEVLFKGTTARGELRRGVERELPGFVDSLVDYAGRRNMELTADEITGVFDRLRMFDETNPAIRDPLGGELFNATDVYDATLKMGRTVGLDDVRARNFAETASRRWANTAERAKNDAVLEANRMFASGPIRRADTYGKYVFLFHNWATRMAGFIGEEALRNPAIIATYIRANEGLDKFQEEGKTPEAVKGLLDLGQTALGWDLYQNPKALFLLTQFVTHPDFDDPEGITWVGDKYESWKKMTGLAIAPFGEAILNVTGVMGDTPFIPDVIPFRGQEVVGKSIDYILAKTGHKPGHPVYARAQEWLRDNVSGAVHAVVPPIPHVPASDPNAGLTDNINSMIRTQNPGLEEREYIAIQQDPSDPRYNRAAENVTGVGAAVAAYNNVMPVTVKARQTERDARMEAAKGPDGDPAAKLARAVDTAATPEAALGKVEEVEYADVAGDAGSRANQIWSTIAYGDDPGFVTVGAGPQSTTLSAEQVKALSQQERYDLADMVVAQWYGPTLRDEVQLKQDAYQADNPHFAEFKDWQGTLKDLDLAVYRDDLRKGNPNAARFLDDQEEYLATQVQPGTPEYQERLDMTTRSMEMWNAINGVKQGVYDTNPAPTRSATAAPPFDPANPTGGGDFTPFPDDGTSQLRMEQTAYSQGMDRVDTALTQIYGQAMRYGDIGHPMMKEAAKSELTRYGVPVPTPGSNLTQYWDWQKLQPPTGDTSIEAFARFRQGGPVVPTNGTVPGSTSADALAHLGGLVGVQPTTGNSALNAILNPPPQTGNPVVQLTNGMWAEHSIMGLPPNVVRVNGVLYENQSDGSLIPWQG